MQDAWHIIRWYWLAIWAVYFTVQILAARRLKGVQKKRSYTVAMVMSVLVGLSDAIRAIFFFENRKEHFMGMLALAIAAVVATIILARMFGESPVEVADSEDDGRKLQMLNLN